MDYWQQTFAHAARQEHQQNRTELRQSKSFSCLQPKEKEIVYRRLAKSGKAFESGLLSPKSYQVERDRLLFGKREEVVLERPRTSYPCAKTVKKKKEEQPRGEWQRKVSARSERERQKTLAWVERVAKSKPVNSPPSSSSVMISGVPPNTSSVALREALSSFGDAVSVQKVSHSTFRAQFSTIQGARNAVDAGTAPLDCVVHVSPVPSDCDHASMLRVMSKWGKVSSVRFLDSRGETTTSSPYSASVVFESSKSASLAAGDRRVEAANELEVVGVPVDATVEHIRRCYGGQRGGVRSVEILPGSNKAVVVFDSPKKCEPHRGLKELVLTVPGGEVDAAEHCRQAARKGTDPPWHTQCHARPFADFDLHSFQFGRAPTTTKEFKKRAAGTFSVHDKFYAGHSLKGSAAKYSTKRCQVHGKYRTMTLHVRQIHATVHIDTFAQND